MGEAGLVVDVVGHLGETRQAENGAEPGVLAVIAGGDDDVAVGDRKHLIGHDVGMGVADPLWDFAGDQIIERLVGEDADGGVDQSRVHIAPQAGLLAPRQRRQDADDRIDAGEQIRDRHAGAGRFGVGGAGEAHEAAHALRHQVVAGAPRIGTGLAETGHRTVDQARIVGRQTLVVETEPGEAAHLEVLDQDVGLLRQLPDDAATILAFEIAFDGALAAVGGMKIGSAEMAAVLGLDERRAPGAGVVADATALDLDHVGAEIGEDLARPGTGEDTGEFENAKAGQRAGRRAGNRTGHGTGFGTGHGQFPLGSFLVVRRAPDTTKSWAICPTSAQHAGLIPGPHRIRHRISGM